MKFRNCNKRMKTRKVHKKRVAQKNAAVAVFNSKDVQGNVFVTPFSKGGIRLVAFFDKLPPGEHGFHIHKAGDMRQKGCMGLCEHFDKGNHCHGAGPTSHRERHTGDLGNIQQRGTKRCKKTYYLPNVTVKELWGRSIIVHKGRDDLGKGKHDDSHITGHSGERMACALFGRTKSD